MTTARNALVLADDGLIEQLQSGDAIAGLEGVKDALVAILLQNNAIVRMLASLLVETRSDVAAINDADIEALVEEITPC